MKIGEKLKVLQDIIEFTHEFGDLILITSTEKDWDRLIANKTYYSIIFSHKFAKAFWNDKKQVCKYCGSICDNCEITNLKPMYEWQWHLQQMVVLDEPLSYLELNLDLIKNNK